MYLNNTNKKPSVLQKYMLYLFLLHLILTIVFMQQKCKLKMPCKRKRKIYKDLTCRKRIMKKKRNRCLASKGIYLSIQR